MKLEIISCPRELGIENIELEKTINFPGVSDYVGLVVVCQICGMKRPLTQKEMSEVGVR